MSVVFDDLDDEEQSNLGGYSFTCKNCGKKGVAKTDRKQYCDKDCRYDFNYKNKIHEIK